MYINYILIILHTFIIFNSPIFCSINFTQMFLTRSLLLLSSFTIN